MITYESTGEKRYAVDTSEETTASNDPLANGSVSKTQNKTKQDVKTITPGNAPVVTKEIYPKVKGVVVVAEGAADPIVKQDLIAAVKSILDVADHKIGVFVKK